MGLMQALPGPRVGTELQGQGSKKKLKVDLLYFFIHGAVTYFPTACANAGPHQNCSGFLTATVSFN